ncbi:MAG: hypothetical protein QME59_06985 [Candidatus Hydrothermarchaeota archaeon]|nr:hypothetical protein [Candidatus Hydrothermarchaeota archaeon]
MEVIRDFEIPLTDEDSIDVRIIKEKGNIKGFVINLRCKFGNVWYQVYRVDTCHEYLHEQRFWISPEPISLPKFEGYSLQHVFEFFMNEIRKNYERYRKYYEERMSLR